MKQDSWVCFLLPSGVVKAQPKHTQGAAQGIEDDDEDEPVLVSGSYSWMLSTVSFFIKEVWVLVRGDRCDPLANTTDGEMPLADIATAQDHDDKTKEKAPPSYTRANLCEVRSVILTFLLFL